MVLQRERVLREWIELAATNMLYRVVTRSTLLECRRIGVSLLLHPVESALIDRLDELILGCQHLRVLVQHFIISEQILFSTLLGERRLDRNITCREVCMLVAE